MTRLATPHPDDRADVAADVLLEVERLRVALGDVRPVDGIDLTLRTGETFALLGESGCGKSMTALALMRLLPDGGRITGGSVRFHGEELLSLSEASMRSVRGGRVGMIFQEPSTSLNPVMTVSAQIGEVLAVHRGLRGAAARGECRRLLEAVGIPDPAERLDAYPFQLSGGMKQRVMIAMALAGEPELLIADEPTTALDVTIQAQVLALLAELQAGRGMGMLLITHDLGVVARMAHRVAVMYAGELVECGRRADFFANPLHPYSRKLFAALPVDSLRGSDLETLRGSVPRLDRHFRGCRFVERCPQAFARCQQEAPGWHRVDDQQVRCHLYEGPREPTPHESQQAATNAARVGGSDRMLLQVEQLRVHFPIRKGLLKRTVGHVRAVDGVDLTLASGRTLALVGESGCGKTTVGKALLRLVEPTGGSVRFDGVALVELSPAQMKAQRRGLQMVFQDPFASLNPRMHVGQIIEEGMAALGVGADGAGRRQAIAALLERVGLSADMAQRYPHAFSGGQRQRVAIARALAVSPKLLVCDEPTSALDVSVQAQILNLLRELQRELGLAYLFITHNLAVVDYLADDVAVMYLGRIVESGPADAVLGRTAHPYTRALLDAVPRIEAPPSDGGSIGGELPSPIRPPAGCHFHPRCPYAEPRCRTTYPDVRELAPGHRVRCHFPLG